jgi:hypothetical protein
MSTITIPSSSSYIDGDWFYIVGEVINNSGTELGPVMVSSTIYDINGTVIGTSRVYTDPPIVLPGDSAPFKIVITSGDATDISLIRRYKLNAYIDA